MSDSVAWITEELNKNYEFIFNINIFSVRFSFNKSVVVLLAGVFCWMLRLFYLLYYLFYLCKFLCTKKKKFPLDFWLPVVYLLFNVYIIFFI